MRLSIAVPLLLLVASLVTTGCDGVTPFERDRVLDPESDNFQPTAPGSVQISFVDGDAKLTWEDVSTNEEGYLVERATDDTTAYDVVTTLPPNTRSFVEERPTALWVSYRITPIVERDGNRQGQSKSVTVPALDFSSTTPTAEVVTENEVRVQWEDVYDVETGYVIERLDGELWREENVFKRVGTVDANVTQFADVGGFRSDRPFTYRVSALREDVQGPPSGTVSNTISVRTPDVFSVSNEPQDDGAIKFSWREIGGKDFVVGYFLERAEEDGAWTTVAEIDPQDGKKLRYWTVFEHVDDTVVTSREYSYRVRTASSAPSPPTRVRYGDGLVWTDSTTNNASGAHIEIVRAHPARNAMLIGMDNLYGDYVWGWDWTTYDDIPGADGFRYLLTAPDVSDLHDFAPGPDGQHVVISGAAGAGLLNTQYESGDGFEFIITDEPDVQVAFLNDRIAVGYRDGTIEVLDATSGTRQMQIDGTSTITDLDFSPDGTQLVSTAGTNQLRIHDLRTAEEIGATTLPHRPTSVQFDPSGAYVLAATAQAAIALDASDLSVLVTTSSPDGFRGETSLEAGFLSGGRFVRGWDVAGGGPGLELWSVDGERLSRISTQGIRALDTSPDGSRLYTSSVSFMQVWRVAPRWNPVP